MYDTIIRSKPAARASQPRAAPKASGTEPKQPQTLIALWPNLIRGKLAFSVVALADPVDRMNAVKAGLPARSLVFMSDAMAIPRQRLYSTLGIARATANRKVKNHQVLSQDESERALGLAQLIGQVERIVSESGDPQGFDAAKWIAAWLERPLPALGGRKPAEFMDTAEGRGIVQGIVARMQSGAYA